MIVVRGNNIDSLKEQIPDYKPNNELQWVDVSSNKLTSFPESFQNLQRLSIMAAVKNKITFLNKVFSKLTRIEDLDLTNNQIREVCCNS